MGKRRLDATERRTQILECACKVFAKWGFKGATTKQIADECEVTEAVLYAHFENKEDLFQKSMAFTHARTSEQWQHVTKDCKNGYEALFKLLNQQISTFSGDSCLHAIILHGFSVAANDESYRKVIAEYFNHSDNFIISLLEDGIKDGSIRQDTDIELIASLLKGLIWVLIPSAVLDFNTRITPEKTQLHLAKLLATIKADTPAN